MSVPRFEKKQPKFVIRIIYHGNGPSLAKLFYRFRHFTATAIVARSIFAIPASQNKTELSFSAAAHIMIDLRSMLDPSHLDELVILRSDL